MKKIISGFIIILSLSSLSWADDWKLLASDHLVEVFYNASRVTYMSNQIIRVWINSYWSDKGRQLCLERFKLMGDVPRGYKALAQTQMLMEIDCKERRAKPVWVAYYDKDHKKIEPTLTGPDFDSWKPISYSSMLAKVVKAHCRK